MAKVKIWKRLDGGVSITSFNYNLKLDSETEDEFIERQSVNLRLEGHLSGSEEVIIEDSNLPSVKDQNRNKWRLSQDKKNVSVDNSVVLPEETRQGLITSGKVKLKNGAPLTDDEIDAMCNGV